MIKGNKFIFRTGWQAMSAKGSSYNPTTRRRDLELFDGGGDAFNKLF